MIYTSPFGEIQNLPKGNAVTALLGSSHRFDRNKVAYTDGPTGEELTFQQVDTAVGKLATVLEQEFGITKGDVIVLSVLNSIYVPILHLAGLSLGATISPANIMYEPSDLAHQFNLVQPKLMVYSEVSKPVVLGALDHTKQSGKPISLDDIETLTRRLLTDNTKPTQPIELDGTQHPAYYCFSSGTSGLPKCVVTTHQNIIAVALQNEMAQPKILAEIKSNGAIIPMSHIYGLAAFVWCLPYIAKHIVIYPKFDFEQLLQGIVKYKIDNINVVPPIVLLFAKSPLIDKYPEVTTTLKLIKSGAAPISRSTIEILLKRFPNVEITNGYGMTEMSPSSHLKGPDPKGVYQLSSIGWVCASTEMRIVHPNSLKDVEPGTPGEIWVRGPQIMKGYLHNKKATDEMITPDRWLRTGDVGKVDEHEQVYIVDRIKELIKSKGHQVAPAELEGILLEHVQVLDCAVIGIPDKDGVTELPRAYVRTSNGAKIEVILQWFNNKVARHKRLWGGIVEIDAVPKNNSGKILRRLLRERKNDTVVYSADAKL